MYGKSSKHHERHCFILFFMNFHSSTPKTGCKKPDPNCGKTDALTYIILSMLPEIINKMIFNIWKIKVTP